MAAICPPQNIAAIDMFFMSVSAATVTGLNTYFMGIAARSDVYLLTAARVIHIDLKTYQQVILYLVPLLGQLQFINIMVVLVRLYWFERKFKDVGMPP